MTENNQKKTEDEKSQNNDPEIKNNEKNLEEKLKESEDKLLRSLAELENQRRRFEKEIKGDKCKMGMCCFNGGKYWRYQGNCKSS